MGGSGELGGGAFEDNAGIVSETLPREDIQELVFGDLGVSC